ncbi:MAG: discoidin domain-containing protein, partial [Candidatus Omnitrophica bacterium]|nr:discoidin domain-containing protein [Candidatus Omnitrophota bacterium]
MIRIKKWFILSIVCIGFSASTLSAATIEFIKIDSPPDMKGDLSDPLWKKAKLYTGFTLLGDFTPLGKQDEKAKAQTEVYPLYDDHNLYIGVVCYEPLMEKVSGKITAHDGPVFGDDDIEIFLSPGGDRMFQLITNSIGTQYDSVNELYWQVQTTKFSDRWTAEIRIPFSSLELTSGTPASWVFNVGRGRTAQEEYSDIIPTSGFWAWEHVKKEAKTSRLDVDFQQFFYQVKNLAYSTCYTREGKIENTLEVEIANQSSEDSRIIATIEAESDGKPVGAWTETVSLKKGEMCPLTIPVSSPLQNVDKLRWSVELRNASSGKVFLSRVYKAIEEKPLLDVFEVQPVYNSAFYTGQERKVVLDINVNSLAPGLSVVFTVSKDEKILATYRKPLKKNYVFDWSSYPCGKYRLETRLLEKDRTVLAQNTRVLEILKPAAAGTEVTISKKNYLLVDNKPFFPIGFFHAPFAEEKVNQLGFTANFTYDRALDLDIKKLQGLITTTFVSLSQLGMMGMIDMEGTAMKDLSKDRLSPEETENVKRVVTTIKEAPGLLGYYLHDEPEGRNVSSRFLADYSRIVKETDPYHPTIVLGHTIGIKKYFVSDIYMPDAYIDCPKDKPADMRVVKTDMGIASEIVQKRRGKGMVMATLKAIDYTPDGSGQRAPTFTEMRNSSYGAVIYGARGIFYYTYYGHSGVKAYPGSWEAVKMVAREMKYLAPAVMDGEPVLEVKTADSNIDIFARRYRNNLYLIAINKTLTSREVDINIGKSFGYLNVLSEGRKVTIRGGKFSDRFEDYGVHIYTTDPAMPNLKTLAVVKNEIVDVLEKAVKKGNIAHAALGTKIQSSTSIAWGGKLTNIINGVTDDVQWLFDYVRPGTPQWIELNFPKTSTIQKVVVYNAQAAGFVTVIDYQIQVNREGSWVTVATGEGNTKPVIEETFPAVV